MRRLTCLYVLVASFTPLMASALTMPALPSGMCALDEKLPPHKIVIDYLTTANGGANQLLATFAACDELAGIKSGKGDAITRYGAVMQQTLGEKLPMDRETYVRTVATTYQSKGALLTEAAQSMTPDAIASGSSATGIVNPARVTVSPSQSVHVSNVAAIIGLEQVNTIGGKETKVASSAAMTLIAGQPISVNLYAPLKGGQTFAESTEILETYVKTMIAANP
jgi:hypothetical protein